MSLSAIFKNFGANIASLTVTGTSVVSGRNFETHYTDSIGSSQADYTPSTYRSRYRISTAATTTITISGLKATSDGDTVSFTNVDDTQSFVFANQSTVCTTDADRFLIYTGANATIAPNYSITFVYDGTTARWRMV